MRLEKVQDCEPESVAVPAKTTVPVPHVNVPFVTKLPALAIVKEFEPARTADVVGIVKEATDAFASSVIVVFAGRTIALVEVGIGVKCSRMN